VSFVCLLRRSTRPEPPRISRCTNDRRGRHLEFLRPYSPDFIRGGAQVKGADAEKKGDRERCTPSLSWPGLLPNASILVVAALPALLDTLDVAARGSPDHARAPRHRVRGALMNNPGDSGLQEGWDLFRVGLRQRSEPGACSERSVESARPHPQDGSPPGQSTIMTTALGCVCKRMCGGFVGTAVQRVGGPQRRASLETPGPRISARDDDGPYLHVCRHALAHC
jgi:hypothetical protein